MFNVLHSKHWLTTTDPLRLNICDWHIMIKLVPALPAQADAPHR
jgi:hypothetical protein